MHIPVFTGFEGVSMSGKVPQSQGGILPCGLGYIIDESRKKSPGLTEGVHFIAVFKGLEVPIHELPPKAFLELSVVAHDFAVENAFFLGGYRVAYNGPGVWPSQPCTHPHHVAYGERQTPDPRRHE